MRGIPTGPTNTDVDANTTHRTSDGSDHTYINQSVTTSASPTFAGVTSTGAVAVDDTTDSSSATTGSIQTDGGLGVAKKAYIGGKLTVSEPYNTAFQVLGDFFIPDITLNHYAMLRLGKNGGVRNAALIRYKHSADGGTANELILGFVGQDTMTLFSDGDVSFAGDLVVGGSLSKSSGSFRIDHPLPEMEDTHYLYHSFVEGPRADNIYRGVVTLVAGTATVNLDEVSCMTEGTFVALNKNVQTFTTNEQTWDNVRGSVSGNILTIECEDTASTIDVSWLVIGERQDAAIMDAPWIDEEGCNCIEQPKSGA